MFRISFSFLFVLLFAVTFSSSFSPSAEAYNQSHVDKLVKEKKRVKAAKTRLATEIEDDTLTDAQKKELIPKCLDCDLSRYDFSEATNVCVVTDKTTNPPTEHCEDLTELDDFDFTGSNLHEANLKQVEARDAVFLKTNMVGAKFNDADLSRSNLSNSTLTHADFACANMQDVLLGSSAANGAMFPGADMRRSGIIFTDMCATDLTKTNLSEAHIEAVNMAVAKVVRTNFTDARMYVTMKDATALFTEYWDTPQAQLAFAQIRQTEGGSCYTATSEQNSGDSGGTPAIPGKTDVSTATFAGVDLSGSDLRGVNFSSRNFSNADLSDTNLAGANLSNANLRGADLTNVNLKGADLSSADFTGATMPRAFLKDANISGTKFDNAKLMDADMRGTTRTSSTSFTNANLSMVRSADVAFAFPAGSSLANPVTPPVTNRMIGSTHHQATLVIGEITLRTSCLCTNVSCTTYSCGVADQNLD